MKLRHCLALLFISATSAHAFDMVGLISYNIAQLSNQPASFVDKGNSIGYVFLSRLDLGPGQIETGFQYTPVSITLHKSFDLKASGSYWILPLNYHLNLIPPFFSIFGGIDYAVEGNTSFEFSTGASGAGNGGSSGYRSHFGYQIGAEASQDLGENLSAILDFHYRGGIGEAIAFDSQDTKLNFFVIALGLKKHLE